MLQYRTPFFITSYYIVDGDQSLYDDLSYRHEYKMTRNREKEPVIIDYMDGTAYQTLKERVNLTR